MSLSLAYHSGNVSRPSLTGLLRTRSSQPNQFVRLFFVTYHYLMFSSPKDQRPTPNPVRLQDYIHSTHGKEMDLLRTTVKVPGKRPPRAISAFGPSASINGLVKDMSTVQMGEGPGKWGP